MHVGRVTLCARMARNLRLGHCTCAESKEMHISSSWTRPGPECPTPDLHRARTRLVIRIRSLECTLDLLSRCFFLDFSRKKCWAARGLSRGGLRLRRNPRRGGWRRRRQLRMPGATAAMRTYPPALPRAGAAVILPSHLSPMTHLRCTGCHAPLSWRSRSKR